MLDTLLEISDQLTAARGSAHAIDDALERFRSCEVDDLEAVISDLESYDPEVDTETVLPSIQRRLRGAFETTVDAISKNDEEHSTIVEEAGNLAVWVDDIADRLHEQQVDALLALVPVRSGAPADPMHAGHTLTQWGWRSLDPEACRVSKCVCRRSLPSGNGYPMERERVEVTPRPRVSIDPRTGLPPRPKSLREVMAPLTGPVRGVQADPRAIPHLAAPPFVPHLDCGICHREHLRQNGYPIFGGPDKHDPRCPNRPNATVIAMDSRRPEPARNACDPCTLCRTGRGKKHGKGCSRAKGRRRTS